MRRLTLIFLVLLAFGAKLTAQDFIPLWPQDKMPNTKGLKLEEVLVDGRVSNISVPGIYPFFPCKEENKKTAVIICPGGGYCRLAYDITGFQLAKWFNTIGVTAFVLKNRLPNSPDVIDRDKVSLQDVQRAMCIVRANAEKWNINPDKIGIVGTSAGGHLASTLGTHLEDVSAIGDSLDEVSFHPNFMILISPVITMGTYTHAGSRDNLLGDNPSKELIEKYSNELQVTSKTPPCFLIHAFDDDVVNPRNSIMFFQALLDKQVPATLHVFPQGQHKIAVSNNPGSTALWTKLCEMWLKEMGFI
jgi:acetyl esterase/lipase